MVWRKITFAIFLSFFAAKSFSQTLDTVTKGERTDSARETKALPVSPSQQISGYIIHGKAQDMNTAEGLPFATVFFPRTNTGTAADVDGNFILKVDRLPKDTLKIEAIGYKPVVRVLRKSQHEYNMILEMERTVTSLDEVVFRAGEDPAVVLMRQIIARKRYNNPDRVDNYKYESYNRLEADLQRMTREQFQKIPLLRNYSFIFDNLDTVSESQPYLPMYLTETLSDCYYQRNPKKQREVIKASMIKGVNNENVVRYLGGLYQKMNIYDNYVPVLTKKYVSPISDDALFFYKYKIKDTQMARGHRVIRIQFRPKRPEENCFNGEFWVVDSVLAIERLSMDISKDANINWVDKISFFQEFSPVDTVWFCTKDKLVVNFTFYGSKKVPGLIGRKTTTFHKISINDYEVAKAIDDPELKMDVNVDEGAKQQTEEWWKQNRPDSLSKNEIAINKMVDTINNMPLTRYYKNAVTFLVSGVKDVGPIQLGPYFTAYSRNPVEGHRFRLSVGTPRTLKDAHITAYLAYGTKDEQFKYGGTALWILQRQPRMYVYGFLSHDLQQRLNNYDKTGTDNIFSSLVRKPGIPWKLAFADDRRVEWYKEYFNGFSHKLMLTHRDYRPYQPIPGTSTRKLAPLPSVQVFVDKNEQPATSVINTEVGIDFRYAYKEKYVEGQYKRITLKSRWPILNVEVSAGIKGVLNSAYEYQRVRVTLSENINIPPFGKLYYSVFSGKYFGTLPYALLEIHPGNESYYYNKFAFAMMNNYEFISDQYAGFNIEHSLGGGIFNRIPLLKRAKWRQFWTAKGVIGKLSDENFKLNMTPGYQFKTLEGNPYLELGTGISNIFELFRIDFVWRVTPKPLPTEHRSKYFGIFGSVRFDF
jgi:hypothetical protein